ALYGGHPSVLLRHSFCACGLLGVGLFQPLDLQRGRGEVGGRCQAHAPHGPSVCLLLSTTPPAMGSPPLDPGWRLDGRSLWPGAADVQENDCGESTSGLRACGLEREPRTQWVAGIALQRLLRKDEP